MADVVWLPALYLIVRCPENIGWSRKLKLFSKKEMFSHLLLLPSSGPINEITGRLVTQKIQKVVKNTSLAIWNNINGISTWIQLPCLQEIYNGLIENVNIELYNALHNHMVNKRMLTKDLRNGMTLVSMYNNQKLHINHYPNGVSLFI